MPSIAIVGAGPAGLTLARLLAVNARKHKISDLTLRIFENDESATSRLEQGGTLDLHTATGIAALKAGEMWDDILPHMRYEGEELIFADQNATTLIHRSPGDANQPRELQRPEIDREILKQYLLKYVQEISGEDVVSWGKHLVNADSETGILKFRDGTEAGPFDLVVGAEGAWSKIRNVLTDVKPSYSGICGFEAWVDQDHSGKNWTKFEQFVGKGSYFSFSGTHSVMVQRMEGGGMKLALWATKPASWPVDLMKQSGGDGDKLKKVLLEEFGEWDDQFKQIIECCWHWRQWTLYELPVGHHWDHKKGWTLIGDSAHLMTPFAGEGVNAAMKDSLELANGITAALLGKTSLDEAVVEFEREMFTRNEEVQGLTYRNKIGRFRKGAPAGFLSELVAEFIAGRNTHSVWNAVARYSVQALAFSFFWSAAKLGILKRYMRGT